MRSARSLALHAQHPVCCVDGLVSLVTLGAMNQKELSRTGGPGRVGSGHPGGREEKVARQKWTEEAQKARMMGGARTALGLGADVEEWSPEATIDGFA